MKEFLSIENRRYIGSKSKLATWIMDVVKNNTDDVHSFCDIFAGTGVVASYAVPLFDDIILNDILDSNVVVYNAFMGDGNFDEHKILELLNYYNSLDSDSLPENYFSHNFGDKYFEKNIAKLAGFIRQDIEDRAKDLTEKERDILLTTLIYNLDRHANTVGHFDAYIKKDIQHRDFKLVPIKAESFNKVHIYQKDANELAREIVADVVYIDPPYNSRQYCDAYHLYENLVQWEKPQLKGVALKFTQKDKKSDYCTNKAVSAFEDLIMHLNAKYIILSYNNMAQKGNGRSNAKMDDSDILSVMSKRGEVSVFAQKHRAYTTGKSNIKDNQERLFLCKVAK